MEVKSKGGNKIAYWVGILIFYFLSVLLHIEVGGLINGLFDDISRASYNNIVTGVVLATSSVLAYTIYRKHQGRALPKRLWLILSYTVIAIIVCFAFLFVIHIEAIHFVQYAILAYLMRGVISSYLAVAIIATLMGAYDELYQYLVLDTMASYYDFNDVFLDAVGTGIGLLGSWFVRGYEVKVRPVWWRRPEWVLLAVTALVLCLMAMIGEFTVNPKAGDPALLILFKRAPQGFWHYPAGPYARFHILTPIPGLILIAITVYIYGLLDKIPIER